MTNQEVVGVLADIGGNKAPGCDGFNAYFFKQAWPSIVKEIIDVALHLFTTCVLYKDINYNTVTLTYKAAHTSKV